MILSALKPNWKLERRVAALEQQMEYVMATLQDVIDEVAVQKTTVASLATFVQGLQDKINALPGITPAMQAQIDQVFADVDVNNKAIAAAMVANVPPVAPAA